MVTVTLICAIASTLFSFVTADTFSVDFKKEIRRDASHSHLYRRQKSVQVPVSNEEILYLINITIGTPPQSFSLQIDTGSSDTWVASRSSDVCREAPIRCSFGYFVSSLSKTYKLVALNAFQIRYQDNSQIEGDYFTDTVVIGDRSIVDMQMGLARYATRGVGILGIGFQSGESIAATDPDLIYPNLVNQLKNQKYINSLAYSLWLNDLDSNSGSILFGGVDTEKYEGDLSVLPIQIDSQSGDISSFTVALSGISISNKAGKSQYSKTNLAIPVILDSGTTNSYLPDDLARAIMGGVGAISDPDWGVLVPCNIRNTLATFSFTFGGSGGPTIKVDVSEFVTSFVIPGARAAPTFRDNTPACRWGLQPAEPGDPILFGDTFLRSAYVVYNLQNEQIGIAQTTFNASKANIVEFSGDSIPGASTTVTGLKVTQTYSGHPLQTGDRSPTGSPSQIGNNGHPTPTFDLNSSKSAGLRTPIPPRFETASLVTAGVVLLSLICGGSVVFLI